VAKQPISAQLLAALSAVLLHSQRSKSLLHNSHHWFTLSSRELRKF
jgi:hypothetical protein